MPFYEKSQFDDISLGDLCPAGREDAGEQGITTYMLRSQAILGGGSCSYALKVEPKRLERSLEILRQCQIPVNGVYVLDQWGHYQKAQ